MSKTTIKKILREEINLLNHKGEENLYYLKDMILQSLQHPKKTVGAEKQSTMLLNLIDMFQQMLYSETVYPREIYTYMSASRGRLAFYNNFLLQYLGVKIFKSKKEFNLFLGSNLKLI